MPKCDFNKTALQLYWFWNWTSAWVFSSKFAAYFQNIFSNEHLWTAASEARNCKQFFLLVEVIFIGRKCTAALRLKLLYSKSPTTFQTNMKFRLAYCVLKILCVLLQYNISSRLSSLLHSIWHEILRKLRIFPKGNYIKHYDMPQ